MWEDGPAPASVVYVADAWVRGLRNPLVPMGYTSLVSLKAARGERVQVTPCGGGCLAAGRRMQRQTVRVIPRFRGGISHLSIMPWKSWGLLLMLSA